MQNKINTRLVVLTAFLTIEVLPSVVSAQSNSTARSSLTDIELAFGFDTGAEDAATNEMAVCRMENRWKDLASAASNAVQRWPREQYFENWLTALEQLRDHNAIPGVCRLYMERCPQQRPSLYYRWTNAMRQSNRVAESISQLTEWTKQYPGDITVSGHLATELVTEKRYDEAIQVLRNSLEYTKEAHSRHTIWTRIIDALEAKNDLPAAIESAEKDLAAVATSKQSRYYLSDAARRLGRLLKKAGKLEAHVATLEKRVEENPGDTGTLRILAELAATAGDDIMAVKYRNLLAEKTKDLPSLIQLREALERTGSTNAEIVVIEKLLASEDSNRYSGYAFAERLALLYAATGDTVRACAMMERSIAQNPSPDTFAKASSIALSTGNKELANKWIDEALKKKPQDYSAQTTAMQLIALGRYREALDLAMPEKKSTTSDYAYHQTQVVQALIRQGKTNMVMERLNQKAKANTSSTDVDTWRQLASVYQEASDYTNAAACWKRALDITGNDYERQWWIRSLEKTDQIEPRYQAIVSSIKKSSRKGSYDTYALLSMAQSFQALGQTNRVVEISDIILEYSSWDVQHENFVRMFSAMDMPDRALKHVKAGLDAFEKNNHIPQGDHLRRQAWPILLKYRMTNEIVEYLNGAARHGGVVNIDGSTLAKCADTLGPEYWNRLVEEGESPGSTITQQIVAVFMLNGSNLYPRANDILQRVYTNNPCISTFDLLKDNYYMGRRDKAAMLSLYTNHLDRVPESIKNMQFVSGMLNAYSSDPVSGVSFALMVAASFPVGSGLPLQTAQLLQTARRYDDAMTVCTNALGKHVNTYVISRIASIYEDMGQPAKGAVVTFHARTLFSNTYEASECTRNLERIVKKPGVPQNLLDMAEAIQQGKPVDCLYADKVDWPVLTAWAAEKSGDYSKAIAFHRKAYEKTPSPSTGRAIASLLFRSGSPDEAIAIQTKAIQDADEKDKHAARMELLRMLVADGRYAQADPMADQMLSSAKATMVTKELGDIRAEIETGRKQQEFVQNAIDKADAAQKDAGAQRAAAQSLRLTGRHKKAADYYRRSLAIDDLTSTRWDLAYVLSSAKQHKDAIVEYQTLLGREISNPERDSAIKAIAESYDALGDTKQTLAFLTSKLGEINTSIVKKWANARIKTLREDAP